MTNPKSKREENAASGTMLSPLSSTNQILADTFGMVTSCVYCYILVMLFNYEIVEGENLQREEKKQFQLSESGNPAFFFLESKRWVFPL